MGILAVFSAIWDGYSAAEGAGELGGFAVSMAGMQLAEAKIEQGIRSYIGNKSEANTRAVRADMRIVRDYLRTITVEQPAAKDLFDSGTAAKYQVSIALANYATQLITTIHIAVDGGQLPPLDDEPWSSRRRGYVRLCEGARAMTLQFEAMVRRKRRELTEITAFEARLFQLAFADGLADSDLRMIQEDMNEQKRDEGAARRSLALFSLLANRSRNNAKRFATIIESGDRAASGRK